jgi:hypothetical protein
LPHHMDVDVAVYVGDDVMGGKAWLQFVVAKVEFYWGMEEYGDIEMEDGIEDVEISDAQSDGGDFGNQNGI